jgi:ORF6N domain
MELQIIQNKIYEIRGCKVMLDSDLAELYEVETKVLNQGVKRNSTRFPEDFMFQLTDNEYINLKSQFVTSSLSNYGGVRKMPFVFTEQGVAMLSSVLRSEKAVQVNIAIMRTFVAIRQYAFGYKDLKEKIEQLESKYDGQIDDVHQVLNELLNPENNRKEIGFQKENTKSQE